MVDDRLAEAHSDHLARGLVGGIPEFRGYGLHACHRLRGHMGGVPTQGKRHGGLMQPADARDIVLSDGFPRRD